MNSLTVAGLGCGALYLGYLLYGRFMARLWQVDPNRKTPAVATPDGVDYVPARHWTMLFGHHFASIAGAVPIVGPVWACAMWGWLPGLIWIVLGAIFMGGVHDFSCLMASVRTRGRSIAQIAESNLGHRVRLAFGGFLWLALVLIVAVFAHLGGQSLASMPQVVIPTFGVIGVAILVGLMMYRSGMPQWTATALGLGLLSGLVVLGYFVPVNLPFSTSQANGLAWSIVLLVYAYIASILPVNLLLQPRDYLATFVLYAGLLLGYLGMLITHPSLQAPPVVNFSSSLGPLWPMLFITIACGAISGFHCLVATGTTSKQIASEAHATRIGFGAMIVEAALALLALIAVCAGLRWSGGEGSYTALLADTNPMVTFAHGFAALTKPILGPLGALAAITVLKTFVMTTLDSATRITRYIGEELFGEGLGLSIFRNRFVSTAVAIGLAFYLLMGRWESIFPVFGSANQLIAALALIVVTVVLWRQRKPVVYTLVPAILVLVTAVGGLVYQGLVFLHGGKLLLVTISGALLVLAAVMVVESLRAVSRGRDDLYPMGGTPDVPAAQE